MTTKPCRNCGSTDKYATGKCKPCSKAAIKRYRARERGDRPVDGKAAVTGKAKRKSPVRVVLPYMDELPRLRPPMNFSESVLTSKGRLKYALGCYQHVIDELDRQLALVDKLRDSAERVTEVRHYTVEKRKLLNARIRFDQRLAKELCVFQELLTVGNTETRIDLVLCEFPPREFVEKGEINWEKLMAKK
jgi:hypothetical protein